VEQRNNMKDQTELRNSLEKQARNYYRQLVQMYCHNSKCGDEIPFGTEEQFIRNYILESTNQAVRDESNSG